MSFCGLGTRVIISEGSDMIKHGSFWATLPVTLEVTQNSLMLLSIPGGPSSVTEAVWVRCHRGHLLGPACIELNVSGLVEVSGLGLLL